MAHKYVDLEVLQYAVQTLSQAITKTFAMKKATVTKLEIVNDIPTGKTEAEPCIKVTYADAATNFVLLGLKDILGTKIDLSDYYTITQIDQMFKDFTPDLTNYYTKTEVDGLIPETKDFISMDDVDNKLLNYYNKSDVDSLIPDTSSFAQASELNNYYKKTETYNQTEINQKIADVTPDMSDYYTKTEIDTTINNYYDKPYIDNKFKDYYTKSETYNKTETDGFLDDKADKVEVEALSSKVAQIFSSMIDNTTFDGIIQDIKTTVADKLEDSDLNVIRSDITNLQTKTKNLETNKLDKTSLPTNVSAFVNDAKYQTDTDVSQSIETSANQTLADAKTYVNGRIADINTLDPEDYYNKTKVDNKLLDYYKKTETYTKGEVNTALDKKAGLNTATDTTDGLLSHDLYSIIKDIDPENMGKNGEDGLTPDIEIKKVDRTTTITFTTGDKVQAFSVTDGKDGAAGKDGKNGTNGTNGANGVSFKSAKIDENNHLIVTLSNGNVIDVGNVDSHALEIHNIAINSSGHLIVTLSNGTSKDLGYVIGAKGKGISKIAIDDTTHEIIVTYDDGSTDNAGMIDGVKGDKGDKGEKGDSLKSISIDENENIIVTYTSGATENIGTIVGSKGTKGDKGDPGTSISKVEGKNNKLIVTLSDGTKFDVGQYVGPEGRGIKSVGVNGDYELILTMTDGTIINTGKLEVNVKDIFVTKAELNKEGELIFTFSDGSTQNNGKINGVEGFSIREYDKLASGETIKAGCMMLWKNMIYKVVKDFTCTTNFAVDKNNMEKITTDAELDDLYKAYAAGVPDGDIPMTFEEWMHQWMEEKFDNPIISYAQVINNRAKYTAGAFYNLSYKNCIGGNTFDDTNIVLPSDGTYLLVLDSGVRASASRNGERYSYIYNVSKSKYEFHTSMNSMHSTDYNTAYPGFTHIIHGSAGDIFQVKVKNRYETTYGAEQPAYIYLYRLTGTNHTINPDDLYNIYLKNAVGTPMTQEEWIEHIYQRESYRMEAVFSQSYTDATDVPLTGFTYASGNRDLMCDSQGRFYAPYSGMYYLRLQLRLEKSNIYPSRFYLIKNGIFGESGYSSKVIEQSTEGYLTNSAFLQTLNSVFWLDKGDYVSIGFQTSVQDTNTLKSVSKGFEWGIMSSGLGGSGGSSGGGSGSSGSSGDGIQLYETIGIGTLVHTNAVIQYKRRLYRVIEEFSCTDAFVTDRKHMEQIYGSGHGIMDYDDARLDVNEEFLPGEFILKRHQITAQDEENNHYTADSDALYEVITPFHWSGNFDYDKVNLRRVLGTFDDYDTIIRKLETEIKDINHRNDELQEIIDDLASILDDINRTVV